MESTHQSAVPPGIGIDEAQQLLESAGQMQAAARREIHSHGWQWYLVWAAVCVGSSISVFTPITGWFWLAGAPLGIAGTIAVSIREDQRSRVQRHQRGYWLIGGAMTVINFAASAFTSDEVVVVVIWVVLGFGFAGFAMLERQPAAAALFVGLAITIGIAGFLVTDTVDLYMVAGLIFAVAMVSVAVGIRSMSRTR